MDLGSAAEFRFRSGPRPRWIGVALGFEAAPWNCSGLGPVFI